MLKVGLVGWRGMVGSVLMDRMREEDDFSGIEPVFFSTSQAGSAGPDIGRPCDKVQDANDVARLAAMDVIVSCQGGAYTEAVHPQLRANGWRGYWIDAASTLRMNPDCLIVLDPVNGEALRKGLADGIKDFAGGNCTVSLMLMALGGLFQHDLVHWMTSMTYQAASGAGAQNMRELVAQMAAVGTACADLLADPVAAVTELDRRVARTLTSKEFPTDKFGAPLAGSLIAWIDRPMEGGQSREEWKGFVETNKILGRQDDPVPVDGICVRIGAMRCHSQALTICLKQQVGLDEIEAMIAEHNPWVQVVPNEKQATVTRLSPAAVTGTLNVPVGRIHRLRTDPLHITAFTVGDQLLWGAAEPLRRMLRIVREHLE